jgi:hypothetical protein
MAKIKVLAGDFSTKSTARISGKSIMFPRGWFFEWVPMKQLASVQIATEENVKRLGGTVGWGVAGAVLLGPLGLLAGLLLGGRNKNVTFVAQFKDGRKFLGTTKNRIYTKLLAAVF